MNWKVSISILAFIIVTALSVSTDEPSFFIVAHIYLAAAILAWN